MGSPTKMGRPASSPWRLRFVTGRGPDKSASKLKALRPHWPERSGARGAISAPGTGQTKIPAEMRLAAATPKHFAELTRIPSSARTNNLILAHRIRRGDGLVGVIA